MPSILYQYARTFGQFFGNGEGINYIPNGSRFSDPASIRITTPLLPEEVSTWELGYKGKLYEKFFMDISYFNGLSKNFFSPLVGVRGRAISVGDRLVTHNPSFAGVVVNDTLKNANFSTIFNFGGIRVYGFDIGANYDFNKFVSLALRYSWMGSDITKGKPENDANKDGHVLADEKSFNGPQNRGCGNFEFSKPHQAKYLCEYCCPLCAAVRFL
jgi:iron complex outermembrane receptor protein